MGNKENYSLAETLTEMINNEKRSVENIAKSSGVSASTIRGWVNEKKTPTLNNAEWVLGALGYKLALEKVEKTSEKDDKQ